MKSLVGLTVNILLDSGMRCGADPSLDIRTVERRVEKEGISFLTITLPNLGQAFERALAEGFLHPSSTPAFSWHRRGLPKFLRGFLLQVFDETGKLRPCVEPEVVLCIRQICLMHKRVLLDCSDERIEKALISYKACENELDTNPGKEKAPYKAFLSVCRVVWSDILSRFPFGDVRETMHPAHGPGATADRVYGNRKFLLKQWHTRLEEHFPYTEFGLASVRNLGEGATLDDVEFVEPQDELPVRVTFVPKTMKTPRVIAIEPSCMQYIQQGILRQLVPDIEAGRYTGGHVNFTDQTVNQKLALSSSKDGRYATIDLSEASDRVSSDLVYDMLDVAPIFRDHVFACRSTRAQLPNGEIITLRKFASMGSALCFPMEAMVFFCIIVSARIQARGMPVTPRNIFRMSRDVYIYGDDIIVPVDEAPSLCNSLSGFNLKVNSHKSFWTGRFRESCGVDAYDGVTVKPVYVRTTRPAGAHSVRELVSWVSTANQLYMAGFWKTTRYVRDAVERVLGRLPHMRDNTPGLHWVDVKNVSQYRRWSSTLMRFENLVWVPSQPSRSDCISDDAALLKCFSTIGVTSINEKHLEQSGVRGALSLKRRWVEA